jgi:hypothetical protein
MQHAYIHELTHRKLSSDLRTNSCSNADHRTCKQHAHGLRYSTGNLHTYVRTLIYVMCMLSITCWLCKLAGHVQILRSCNFQRRCHIANVCI